MSPYLVLETHALCNDLKLIQELAKSKKFIIIIPLVGRIFNSSSLHNFSNKNIQILCFLQVIDQLDSMKKDSRLTREAIRWLESQFKQGNRFLRAQNQNEKQNLHRMNEFFGSRHHKKDLDLWRLYQLIECCAFFQSQSNENKQNFNSPSSMVTFLLNNKDELLRKDYINAHYKNLMNLAEKKGEK